MEQKTECVTCSAELRGRYCHECGERVVTAADMRVRRFVADTLEGAFDLDSRVWRTARALVARPGHLTAEHMCGRRRPYLGPLQVFLFANLLFFGTLTTIGGFNTFTTTLSNHLSMDGYGAHARRLVEERAVSDTPEREEYQRRFDETTPRYANSMIILLVPLLAGVLFVLYGGRRFMVHHLVFALHFYAWLLLLLIALSLILRGFVLLVQTLLDAETAWIILGMMDNDEMMIGFLLLSAITWYLVRALQRSYGDRIVPALLRAVVIGALIMPMLLVYRLLLFYTVYHVLG